MGSLNILGKAFLNGIAHHRSLAWPLLCRPTVLPLLCVQERNYAARKGKRMRMRAEHRKKKIALKAVEKEEAFVPYKLLLEKRTKAAAKKRSDVGKKLLEKPIDNVYFKRFYKWQVHNFEDAVHMHRESHHPTMMNDPDALVTVCFNLNMRLQKKNKYVDKFKSIVAMPNKFKYFSARKVLAICNKPVEQDEAEAAGAGLVVGTDIIPKIESGDIMIEEYHYIVSTPDLLSELIPIRGLLKNRFPTRHKGTLSFEIGKMIDRFANGIEYQCSMDPIEKEYGSAEVVIGRLTMPPEELEENFAVAVKELCVHRPEELGPFIREASLRSLPSTEQFTVSCEKYTPRPEETVEPEPDVVEPPPVVPKSDDDETEAKQAVAK